MGNDTNDTLAGVDPITYVVPPIYGLVALIGIVGNILVIIVVLSNKTMRNTPNILILNLAVADLLFLVFCVPFTAARYAMNTWPLGVAICKLVHYLMYVSFYGSVYTLVLMAISQYLAIVRPLKSLVIYTPRNTYIATSAMWAVILCGSAYYLWSYDIQEYNDGMSVCGDGYANIVDHPDRYLVHAVCLFVLGYVVPLGFICVLYGITIRHLVNDATPCDENINSGENARTKRRFVIIIGVVIAVFAVCWFPNLIMPVILGATPRSNYSKLMYFYPIYIASGCLAYFNSCVNAILYALLSERFRKGFRNVICCKSATVAEEREKQTERTELICR